MLVSDEWQNHERLARVDAEFLPDNVAMKKIAKKLGFRLQGLDDSTSIRAVLDL